MKKISLWSCVTALSIAAIQYSPILADETQPASLGAQTGTNSEMTLEWQRASYEARLDEKLRLAISSAISEKFVVSVNIETLKTPVVVVKPAKHAVRAGDDELIPLGKLDLTRTPIAKEVKVAKGFFESIVKVTVTILLDSTVPDSRQEVLRKIVEDLTSPLVGEEGPEVNFEKLDLSGPVVKEGNAVLPWLVQMRTPLTAIFISLMLSVLGAISFKKYMLLENRRLALLEAQSAAQHRAPEEVHFQAAEAADSAKTSHDQAGGARPDALASGIVKFNKLIAEDRARAAALFMQWVSSGSGDGSAAVTYLSRFLKSEDAGAIVPFLGVEARRSWKRLLDRDLVQELSPEAEQRADRFVSAQVLGVVLQAHPEFDDELCAKVAALDLAESVSIASGDTAFGAVIAMLLPSDRLKVFYAGLRPEVVSEIIEMMMMPEQSIKEISTRLKAKIQAIGPKTRPSGLLDRVEELFVNAYPENEGVIFNLLAQSGDSRALRDIAFQYFPSDLITKLDPKILRTCLAKLSVESQAELLRCCQTDKPERREALLSAIGAPGSKARQMIDFETERLVADEVRSKRVSRQSKERWREYVEAVRSLLKKDEQARALADEALGPWLASLEEGSNVA